MSGLAIPSPALIPLPPVVASHPGIAESLLPPAPEAAPGTAESGAGAPADVLNLSALAQTLEKLAQAPGINGQFLAKIMTLAQNQGELLQFLSTLNASGGGQGLPPECTESLKSLASPGALDEASGEGSATSPSGATGASAGPDSGSAGAGREMFQEFQALARQAIGQVLLSFVAPVKASLGSLAPGLASEAVMNEHAVEAGGTQTGAAGGGDGTPVTEPAAAVAPDLALAEPGANPAATELAGALRQLAAAGRLLASPLLRQDYMSATLGMVSTLLREPALSEALRRPGTALHPPPAPAATSATGTASAPNVPDRQSPAAMLGTLLRQLTPLLAPGDGKGLERIESLAGDLARVDVPENGMPGASALSSERQPELMPRGTRLASVTLDSPDLPLPATALNPNSMSDKTQTRRNGSGRSAPGRIMTNDAEQKSGAKPVARGGAHEPLKGAAAGLNNGKSPANGNIAELRARTAHDLFTALLFSDGEGREAPGADRAQDSAAARTRLEQYSHPEAFRPGPQAHQAAATVQLAAFFKSHREDALSGKTFTARADEQAVPARLLLEYKPIEILRPARSAPATGQSTTSQATPPPVIDVQPVAVLR